MEGAFALYSAGLSAADLQSYLRSLAGDYALRIQVQLLDLEQNVVADISSMLIDGQVNADKTADVTRSCSITLFDKDRQLPLDSNAPTDGALFLDRMIRVNYITRSFELFDHDVSIPIFTGPIVAMSRTGSNVQVEAQGKEVLAKRPAWRTRNYAVGSRRSNIIRELLENVGETKFSLDEWTLRTADPFGVTRETDVWELAKRMARGRTFYYNGSGHLVLRPWQSRAIYTFKTGEGGTILTEPEINYDVSEVRNIVWVVGGVPKGAKYPVQYTAYAQASHPLSAQSLGRNGFARHMPEKIEDSNLLTKDACVELANAKLAELLLNGLTVSFDAMPVPVLELDDVVQISTPEFSFQYAVDSFSIGLRAGASMSCGYLQRRSISKAKIRSRR